MGTFYLLTSLLSYFGLTLIGPIGNFMNRNVHKWKSEGTLFTNLFRYNLYLTFVSIISIPIVYFSHNYLGILSNIDSTKLVILISSGIYFTTLNTFFAPTLNLFNYRVSFVVFSNLTLLFNIIFSVILVSIFERNGMWWFSGQILSQALFAIVSGFYFFSKFSERKVYTEMTTFSYSELKSVLRFSLPLAVATLFLWSTNESYRFIVEKFLSLEYLGILAVGIAVSTKISTAVETLLHQLFHPKFFKSINSSIKTERANAWNSFFNNSLPAYIAVTLFMSCLSPFLLRLLSGREFYSAWPFLIFGAILNLIRMVTNHIALIAHTENNTKSLIQPGIVSGVVTILLVQTSVSTLNYQYLVPLSLILGSLLGMIVMIIKMNKIINIHFRLKDIFLSSALSLCYFSAIILYPKSDSLLLSISVILIYGLYFIFTQYYFFKKNNSINI